MRIQDAKPGDVLVDAGGAKWMRSKSGAWCLFDPSDESEDGEEPAFFSNSLHAESFGPFTRLVPEVEPTNA